MWNGGCTPILKNQLYGDSYGRFSIQLTFENLSAAAIGMGVENGGCTSILNTQLG